MKKRLLSLLLALTMALSLVTTGAWAAGQDSIRVTVTIAIRGGIVVGKNNTLMAQVPVTVTDRNGDGKFTYDEAMVAAHKAYYEKGEAGFAMKGNSCEMLWGNETTTLGFYRNNAMTGYINGESVEANDDLTAFVYQDQKGWSDQYCFFDQTTATVKAGESLTLNLKGLSFDEKGNTVSSPAQQAELGVYENGTFQTKSVTTNAEGNGTISFSKAGTYVVSAKKAGAYLIPPVCIVTVTGASQEPAIDLSKEVTNAISTCVNGYQSIKYTKPTYEETTCSFGSEWVMLARLRALKGNEGWTRKSADISHYLTSVKAAMKSKKLSKDAKINDIERVIMTLTALGYDASNFNGQNLTAWLYQNQKWDNYSPNLMIWSLIALDSGNYTAAKGYREGLIAQLVKYQHTSTGGFFFSTAWPADDVDMTAMAMIALAPYKNSNAKAKKMYNAGWKFIQSKADDQYNYGGDSYDPCSTNAYVVIAKCATGQTGGDLDATVAWMLKNYLGKKGFNLNGEYNGMSTYQGLLAMDAYQRASAGATKLFDVKWPANPITVKNVTKTASTKAQTVKLGAKAKENAKLSYKSSSKSVKVDKNGKVTIAKNFVGKATITITSKATKNYKATTKKVTVTVNPAGTKLTSVKNYKGKKLKASWKKNTKGTGYQVQYSTSSKFKSAKTVTVKGYKSTSKTITKLTKNKKYYVRVRTYKTVSKVNYYSGWSNTKSITIKK